MKEIAQLELLFKEQADEIAELSDDLDSVATQPQDIDACSLSNANDTQVCAAGDTGEGVQKSLIDETSLPLSVTVAENEGDEDIDQVHQQTWSILVKNLF